MTGILLLLCNTATVAGAVGAACVAVRARRRRSAVLALAAVGGFLSMEFLFLRAPDAALAEAGVGTALSTALLLLALRRVEREEKK